MPELPEVEITARLLSESIAGKTVSGARAWGVSTLKSFDPPLAALTGRTVDRVTRRGKYFLVEFGDLTLLVHLMSAGRLQLYDTKASPRDRSVRLAIDFEDGRQLRLREFGTRQSAWAKLLHQKDVESEETLATLGPEAWPEPPPLDELLTEPRPLHSVLRDQRVLAGIGRSWVDEILHASRLSPFKRGSDLKGEELERLRADIKDVMQRAIDHYEEAVSMPIPDKLPMPLAVHRREKQPCPRCGTNLEGVFFEDHVIAYCPACQTGGRILKDRRLSRLLK